MSIEPIGLYSCARCGHILSGIEWELYSIPFDYSEKNYKCPLCNEKLNEDELYPQ